VNHAAETSAEQSDEAFAIDEAVESLRRPVEAVLFVASEALSIKQLAKLVGAGEIEVAATVQQIEAEYAERGIVLREVAGGYRFATSPLAREAVEAYLLPPKHTLSVPALEALAIVAHLQPVTKSEIESIRGVNSDSVVSTLLDRNLIEEDGRRDVVGRPMTYKTTKVFLESFGLNSTDDLPPLELEPGQPLELNLLTLQAAAPAASPDEPALDESADGAGGGEPPPPQEDVAYEAVAAEEAAFDDLAD
jgi:segregation and condensation protein B